GRPDRGAGSAWRAPRAGRALPATVRSSVPHRGGNGVTAPSVLLIAPFDDGENAHSSQRARAFERLGCEVTTFDLRKRTGLLGRWGGSDLRSRLLKSVEVAEAELVLVIGGYELDD